jgi:hypothetical protein
MRKILWRIHYFLDKLISQDRFSVPYKPVKRMSPWLGRRGAIDAD